MTSREIGSTTPDPVVAIQPASLLSRTGSLEVQPGEVCLWSFELDVDEATRAQCARFLSPDERSRAARFAFPLLRERFVVAHGVLRHVLARHLGLEATDLRFDAQPHGKPVVAGPHARRLSFNLSHSEHRAVLAVGDGCEIGVDLERVRPDLDILSLARSTFAAPEFEVLLGLPAHRQVPAFFRYWVAKEAVLKGEGEGLGLPVDSFEIAFEGAGLARVTPREGSRVRADWTIRELSLGTEWPVAVAARGRDWRVRAAGPGDG
ncbi:MAG: 4'-phosphopantetheinyl transferase superfamily protein [Betaproteobacteria bacterium]|nr:4'-phosphopantetheinyl transferase superfamily protein [Betaproteobacteria bacterium]